MQTRFCVSVIAFVSAILAAGASASQNGSGLRDTGLICAVDMGSNTFKFIVAEFKNGQYLQRLDIRKTAAVGDDLKASETKSGHKIISEGKITEIKSLLAGFQDECQRETRLRHVYGIATAAFREAENGNAVIQQLQQQGVDVKILSGAEESTYAYEVATFGEPNFAVVDLGSRSTEFVIKTGNNYQSLQFPTGYKLAWDDFYDKAESFSQASSEHFKKLKEFNQEREISILQNRRELRIVEIGETASYILGIPEDQIEGKVISLSLIRSKLRDLSAMDPKSFAALKKNFKDAPKVLPRLVLLNFILTETGYDKLRGTDRELNVAIVYRLAR